MTGLLALADRVESATEGSRELDLSIHVALYPDGDIARIVRNRRGFDGEDGTSWDICGASVCWENYRNDRCSSNGGYPLPAVSSSLDAAMTMVPKNCRTELFGSGSVWSAYIFHFTRADIRANSPAGGIATPALALTAASLRALATAPVKADGPVAAWPLVFQVRRHDRDSWHGDISFARCPTDAELDALSEFLRNDPSPQPAKAVDLEAVAITDDQLLKLLRKHFSKNTYDQLTIKSWKDGIDIDEPYFQVRQFAYAIAALIDGARV